ncbi:MAG: hypothetical protein HN509_13145 [Halobacteriovoraceae bacterium]|jgi:hypothetical protein|nr:hypothetical protein [Halobacteriovoraceae bacterium]MBT5096164.1 hypothetical protein [Halobacteriovoraceae bacterium]
MICYCFKRSKKQLEQAVEEGREQQFIEEVKALMSDPGCFCETANPSGKCCLKDIDLYIEKIKKGVQ